MISTRSLEIFKEITTIPRESGHEGPMTAFLQDFAAKRGLFCKTDSIGNVVIVREAMPGKEQVPTIVLQCHQDMVCEKNPGVEHDFSRDPISYVVEDGWMIAPDTTLGADDGIGIAAALAVLESDLPTGRLECVFTISEETGMDGAFAMEPGFFTGRTLINLDSEDEGQLFIGCAGGLDTFGTFRYFREVRNAGWKGLKISVSNALGGHSGDDINKGRVNAVQQLVRFLYGELPHGLQLILLHGGGKPNAIAREASSLILVPDAEATLARFEAFKADVKGEFSVADPNVVLQAEASPCNEKPIDSVVARRLIATLYGLPHGVLAMSPDIPGLVETSTNLAAVRMNERGVVKVITSQRSAVPSERRDAAARVEAVLKLGGAEVLVEDSFLLSLATGLLGGGSLFEQLVGRKAAESMIMMAQLQHANSPKFTMGNKEFSMTLEWNGENLSNQILNGNATIVLDTNDLNLLQMFLDIPEEYLTLIQMAMLFQGGLPLSLNLSDTIACTYDTNYNPFFCNWGEIFSHRNLSLNNALSMTNSGSVAISASLMGQTMDLYKYPLNQYSEYQYQYNDKRYPTHVSSDTDIEYTYKQ